MVPLFKPYMPAELPELNDILHSGQLAYGRFAREFEERLSDFIGIERVICTNSFNSAYLVLIKALDLKPGDEVIASPMCCLASSQPFAVSGVKLIWADIDPSTGTLNPDSVRKAVSPATKAILHNHFCGYVGYVGELCSIAKEKGLLLIDDVSEAFGSEYQGLKAGNWGADATVYSFQTVRLPNAIDGGALSFKSSEHYKKAELIRDYGIDRKNFRDNFGEISPLCDINIPAYGCLPSDVNAYIGIESLRDTPSLIARQRENAEKVRSTLPDDIHPLSPVTDTLPNYWVFGALADDKQAFISRNHSERQQSVSGVHLPNTFYSLFGKHQGFPGIDEFYSKFIALPCGWWL